MGETGDTLMVTVGMHLGLTAEEGGGVAPLGGVMLRVDGRAVPVPPLDVPRPRLIHVVATVAHVLGARPRGPVPHGFVGENRVERRHR